MGKSAFPQGQLQHLIRHFFGRFFDSEAIAAPHTEMHLLLIQILALLVGPGYCKTFFSLTKYSYLAWFPVTYRDQAVLIDTHFLLCISMILTGFVTVFELEALFPDQKDYYNLIPLPIPPQRLFLAKVIALLLFLMLFHIAINGIPTLLFPGVVLAASVKPGSAGWRIPRFVSTQYHLGYLTGLFVSTLFIFTSFIAIRAVLLLLFPAKAMRIISRYTQLGLIVLLLCSLFSNIRANALIVEENWLIYLLPPFWFLGLFEVMIGHHGAVFDTLARMAWSGVAISTFIAVLSYTISYRSSMQKGFQSAGLACYSPSGARRVWNRILHGTLLRNPVERAGFHFVAQTAFRRQEHMLYWGSFVAVGIALIYLGLFVIKSGYLSDSSFHFNVLLSFPLILSFFILAGLRFAFSVPADLNGNWIFRIMDKQRLEKAYVGACKFMLCVVLVPLVVLFIPVYLMIWEPGLVFMHILYVSILSLILIEFLLFRFQKIPFACVYIPGKANIKVWWPVYVIACVTFSYETTVLERWVLAHKTWYFALIALASLIFFRLHKSRSLFFRKLDAIQFEEATVDRKAILHI